MQTPVDTTSAASTVIEHLSPTNDEGREIAADVLYKMCGIRGRWEESATTATSALHAALDDAAFFTALGHSERKKRLRRALYRALISMTEP